MLRALLLIALAGFAGSSPAFAYPLNDGGGTVIWGFEGHGADPAGGSLHTVTGQLRISGFDLGLDAILDGTDVLTGFTVAPLRNSAPGAGPDEIYSSPQYGAGGILAAPAYALRPSSFYWGSGLLTSALVDSDGVAFDGPSPPPYAPDIALFETHGLMIYQDHCEDIVQVSYQSLCSQGGGYRSWDGTFSITIDRFVDPVPEPAAAALVALGCAVVAERRRRASCFAPCC